MPLIQQEHDDLYRTIIHSNSPWIKDPILIREPEKFKREAFYRVRDQMYAEHEMAVLIKGPRRVGKTEIQKQLIWDLIKGNQVSPNRVLYLTLDDVQIQSERPEERVRMVHNILNTWAKTLGKDTYDEIDAPAYCFLDEVQAVSNWAKLVKNRVERNPNVRIVLSGSAAHSIFEQSLKILLGRVISEKLTTFSFREFLHKKGILTPAQINEIREVQLEFERNLSPLKLATSLKNIACKYNELQFRIYISEYLKDGGFPQLWKIAINNEVELAHIIDENYVKKVTLEDLMLLQQIKKPELYERLLRHLFARPSQEYCQNKIAVELGTTAVTLAEGMKLLEQTDLLIFVEKFSHKAEPLKRKNIKIYPIDMMLTFAMTKILPSLQAETDKGCIAESLTAQTLARLRGINNLAYIRSNDMNHNGELDFFLRSDTHDCPIEVKYQNQIRGEDLKFLKDIIKNQNLDGGLLINIDSWATSDKVYGVPLWAFMLIA
jgi:predicted AAA+ superfamily ATPase